MNPSENPHIPFSFAVAADPHCSEERDASGDSSLERFMRCAAAMEQLTGPQRPDFMLLLGDIHIWALEPRLSDIQIPMHVIAGNHEAGRQRKEQLRTLFPQDFQIDGRPADYYSFVHKGVRFIGVCNAGSGGDHIGHLCSQDFAPRGQCEWLERELVQAEPLKIVFTHVPPHPAGEDADMFMARNDSRYFNALVEQTRPTALFCGHQHEETREFRIGDTRGFILRSSAWNFQQAPTGFMLVHLTPQGVETQEILNG